MKYSHRMITLPPTARFSAVGLLCIVIWLFALPSSAQWSFTALRGSESIECFHTRDSIIFAGIGSRVYRSDDGNSWQNTSAGLPSSDGVNAISSIGSRTLAGLSYAGIFYSDNNGTSWKGSSNDFSPIPSFFSLFSHDQFMFAGSSGDGIYRSSDSGIHWQLIDNGLPVSSEPTGAYCFISYDSLLIAGSPYGEVYRTTNNGDTWQVVALSTKKDHVVAMAFVGSILVAGTSSAMYLSYDMGNTWQGINNISAHGIQSLLGTKDYLIVGVQATILKSIDSGRSWFAFDQNWPSQQYCGALDDFGDYLYAGANFGGGIYRRHISDLASVNAKITSPLAIFPNPLSTSTTLTVTPEAAGYTSISIVNLLGAEVARLYSGELDASPHTFTWNPSTSVPNGVYACVVRGESSMQKLPLVLMR